MFTCEGTLESSYHFRWACLGIGSLVFGIIGLDSIYNKYPIEMFQFASFMLFAAVVHFATWLMDCSFYYLCDSHYSYNVIMEMIMNWPLGFPFGYGTVLAVDKMETYPAKIIDHLCFYKIALCNFGLCHISVWYAFWTFIKFWFCIYFAYEAFQLALLFYYGLAGMGACFSISNWKERLKTKYEMNDVAYNTFGMAMATGMDVGWQEDEFRLQRPLRQPTFFNNGFRPGMPGMAGMSGMMGGVMPGASMPVSAATAYDGFRDDRRNVLL